MNVVLNHMYDLWSNGFAKVRPPFEKMDQWTRYGSEIGLGTFIYVKARLPDVREGC